MNNLSVITICYNCRDDLARTAACIAQQIVKPYEWIIIDGASTDGTAELAQELAKQGNATNMTVSSEPDRGIYDAMNKGVSRATGEWLLFLNAGDTFHDRRVYSDLIHRMLPHPSLPPYGVVSGGVLRCGHDGQEQHYLRPFASWRGMGLCHQSVLFRRSLFANWGFMDTRLACAGDYEHLLRLEARGIRFRMVPRTIARFAAGGVSTTRHQVSLLEAMRVVRRYHGYARSRWHYGRMVAKDGMAAVGRSVRTLLPARLYRQLKALFA